MVDQIRLPIENGASALVAQHLDALVADWQELCRWDPMLLPESRPAIAAVLVAAIGSALSRPQPLGWGPDPELEPVAEAFALAVGSIDESIGQLVCLREAMVRRLGPLLDDDVRAEGLDRLHMVIDRAIGVTAQRTTIRLQEEALTDPLTLLPNRRALEHDLRRELARARRHDRALSVAVIDLDGLKSINDRHGHPAGDRLLRRLSSVMAGALRAGDRAYRVGGDEFVIVLPDTDVSGTERLLERLHTEGAPAFSWGVAGFPDDTLSEQALLEMADERLLAGRATRRSGPG